MVLPVINAPTYTLAIPSTKEEITYRPFLVKEEKLLMIAMETGGEGDLINALRQIVSNCVESELDLNKLATFDLEYIFLRIRAKSVGEVTKLSLLCQDDGETYVPVEIDLEEIEVEFQEGHTTKIELTEDVGIIMSYPTFEFLDLNIAEADVNTLFTLIGNSIHQIYEGETVHERADFNKKELKTFLESLTSEQFKKVQNFFETMPRLRHTIEIENPKTKVMNSVTLEGLQAFFE